MNVLMFFLFVILLDDFRTQANIYEKLDKSVEHFRTVDRSDLFNYPLTKKEGLKRNRQRKYKLRFDPASLKQSAGVPFPGSGFSDFNIEDFIGGLPNGIPTLQTPLLPNNVAQTVPNLIPDGVNTNLPSPPQNDIFPVNNISNLLPGGNQVNPATSTAINNNNIPQIIPNILANQTNFANPTVPGNTGLTGFQSSLPNLFPNSNLRPILPVFPSIGSFPQNQAILPNNVPGFGGGRPFSRPQRFGDMLAMMGSKVKNLFFGLGPTFVKKPESSRGFLNLFDVIKFQNGPCTAALNRIRWVNGTCFYKSECETRGGIIAGTCAEGYGVCCVFRYGCGGQTQEEISYLESPNYPLASAEPLTCAFSILLRPRIEQVRLDLLFFELRQPTAGNCVDDQFVVSGQNINFPVPILCGINSGQHMYIDVDASPERRLQLSIVGRNAGARAFSIKITQIWEQDRAPKDCLQYFREPTGYIKSFNYENVGSIVETRAATYLNNLNYAMCIERAPDKCAVTYTNQVAEGELQFQLFNVNQQGIPLVPPNQAGAEVFNCPDDFIAFNSLRLCGDRLNDGSVSQNFNENAPITEYGSGPIVIPFQSDESVVGRGFKLIYYQESCF